MDIRASSCARGSRAGGSRPAGWQIALVATVYALAGGAAAQPGGSSSAGRVAQYVLVIDDSGSMARSIGGYPPADPDRLAVFAIRSLLSMLDDEDQVSLIRFGGAAAGEVPPPLAPLARQRPLLDRLLALDGPLAAYSAGTTPCATALAATRELLVAHHRPGVPQVVMLLSDGDCSSSEVPDPQRFLAGLPSHEAGELRFYLLRFAGRTYSRELERLALATGGSAIEVSADDPTDIVEPFADALTRSQGYEAEVRTGERPHIAAHRGARRVRLLAVAPGAGEPLSLRIADARGRQPAAAGQPRRGTHRYADGRPFRFVAVDYRPTAEPVTVAVEGAGRDWKVVAVPEYRLAVEMELTDADCGSPGAAIAHVVKAGATICARIRLVNENGRPVERGLAAGIEAMLDHVEPGQPAKSLPAMASPGDSAEFELTRAHLVEGDHVLRPVVVLDLAGRREKVRVAGARRTLQASTVEIIAEPANLDLGELRPGGDPVQRTLQFVGNFQPTKGRLEVFNRPQASCVTFTLSGKPEGEPQVILPKQPYSLLAQVAPYCGPTSFREDYRPVLRLIFDADADEALPVVEVSASLTLDYRIDPPGVVELSLAADGTATAPIRLSTNAARRFEMLALVDVRDESRGWPGPEDLRLGFAGDRGGLARDGRGEPLAERTVSVGGGADTILRIAAAAGRCCGDGTWESELALVPAPGGAYAGAPPPPLRVPVRVRVTGAGFWSCWGGRVLLVVALLLAALLVAYLVSMARHSSFLDRRRLGQRLAPLVWNGFGGTENREAGEAEAGGMVRRALPWKKRAAAWLRANPLVFGLPGRRYDETAELDLHPEPADSRIWLRAERDLHRRLANGGQGDEGRLFVRARGSGLDFFGVPDDGVFGRLRLTGRVLAPTLPGGDGDEPRRRPIVYLKPGEKLLHAGDERERHRGQAAGWEIR